MFFFFCTTHKFGILTVVCTLSTLYSLSILIGTLAHLCSSLNGQLCVSSSMQKKKNNVHDKAEDKEKV